MRMGQDKAFVQIHGVPIIRRIYNLFTELFGEVIIVTNQTESFKNFGSKIYQDLIQEKGALGGLYTGISYSSFQYSFCVACDMPFVQKSLVEYLIRNIEEYDVVAPRTRDGLQPLHAIYSKKCLDPIRKAIDKGKYKIIDFYKMVSVRIVEEDEFLSLDPLRDSFINVNTREELLSLKRHRESLLK